MTPERLEKIAVDLRADLHARGVRAELADVRTLMRLWAVGEARRRGMHREAAAYLDHLTG